jgi:predicted nucleic acid-binding Zn ribbon protein
LVVVVFKGPGFYSTDNGPSSPEASAPSAKKEQKKHAHKEKTQPENASKASDKTD